MKKLVVWCSRRRRQEDEQGISELAIETWRESLQETTAQVIEVAVTRILLLLSVSHSVFLRLSCRELDGSEGERERKVVELSFFMVCYNLASRRLVVKIAQHLLQYPKAAPKCSSTHFCLQFKL